MLYPIKKLLEGRNPVVCVSHNNTIQDALTLMISSDFSQLPVVDSDGNLTGIITEDTINREYYHLQGAISLLSLTVDHCQVPAVTLPPESDIFDALDRLRNVYAIVVVEGRKPTGILTNYDMTYFFRDISAGLILVEDIELRLREYIEAVYSDEAARLAPLMAAFGPDRREPSKPAHEYETLTFGQHVQLITTEHNWPKFERFLAPKELFNGFMQPVGRIRNKLAHFRGRPDAIEYDALRLALNWLNNRPRAIRPKDTPSQTVAVDSRTQMKQNVPGNWETVHQFLLARKDGPAKLQLGLADIESLLGESLPAASREHPSWWSNDYSTNPRALHWLKTGRIVEDLDLAAGTVVFRRRIDALRQLFFADLLERLKRVRPGVTQSIKASLQSWFDFGAGRSGFAFTWSFVKGGKLQVELYVDTGDKEANETAFDALYEDRETIEQEIGEPLLWQRLDEKRACRIALTRPLDINAPEHELEQGKQWALTTMLKFIDAFQGRIRGLS